MVQVAAEQLTQERSSKQGRSYRTRTMCRLCLNGCGIVATVENGMVVRIDGDPDNPHNLGKACAKGRAGFFTLESPYRIKQPLRRTNPEKGAGVDPGWVPMSWDEALDLVAARLKQIQEDDCRRLWFVSFDYFNVFEGPWSLGFGTLVQPSSSAFFCGNAVHSPAFLNQFALDTVPDVPLTRYVIAEGTQWGGAVHYDTMNAAFQLGRNREKVKVVSVDPVCTHAASMADEWIGIRPGTDAAFLLGLANVMINELGIYDAPFLKNLTNAPYLVGADGQYVRDANTRKPLIWDLAANLARPFDAAIGDAAILGTYQVAGQAVRPAFQVIADQVRKYPPEEVSRITSVPAATVRRIAKEFGEAASIGSTITIDGEQLPYRPACVLWSRGLSHHKHAHLNGMAGMLLQTIIGGQDVPGGSVGYHRSGCRPTDDGLLTVMERPGVTHPTSPYPPRTVTQPRSIDLFELFPVACFSRAFAVRGITQPERYGNLTLQPKMLIQRHANMAYTGGGKETMAEVFRRVPFIVSIASELGRRPTSPTLSSPGCTTSKP
jgi:anaerobic selenocysteine-containing dehydrogenase